MSFSFKGKVCISNRGLILLRDLEAVFLPLQVAEDWSVSHECLGWEVLVSGVSEDVFSRAWGQCSLGGEEVAGGGGVGMGDIRSRDGDKPGRRLLVTEHVTVETKEPL